MKELLEHRDSLTERIGNTNNEDFNIQMELSGALKSLDRLIEKALVKKEST